MLIASCCGHWEECQKGDLFVAIVDDVHDGHEYAHQAIEQGASAVLCERLLPLPAPQCIVPDSRIAYGEICHALAGDPCNHIATIGVSGTDGKTTTAHLIHSIFEESGLTAGLSTSIYSDASTADSNSFPDQNSNAPPQLAGAIARMVAGGKRFAVLESSSVSLAQHHLAGIALDIAVLTNIRGSRFEFHNNLANYRRAQIRLLDYLKPTGLAIMNADDPTSFSSLDRLDTPTITIGTQQPAEIEGSLLHSDLNEQTFLISAGNDTVTVRSQIIGSHHIYNCLAAAAVGVSFDIDLATIARGIERVKKLPGRMDQVICGQPFNVTIDQARSPYRLGVALQTLKRNCKGRVICVFSVEPDTSPEAAGQFGRIAERSSDISVITLNRQGKLLDYEPAHRILDGFAKPQKAHLIPDRIKSIQWALSLAQPGDVLLVAGRGDHAIATIGDDRWQVTDRDVCESWLYGERDNQENESADANADIFRIDDYR